MMPPVQSSLSGGDRNISPGTSSTSGRPTGIQDVLKKIILQKMLSSRPTQGVRPMGGGR